VHTQQEGKRDEIDDSKHMASCIITRLGVLGTAVDKDETQRHRKVPAHNTIHTNYILTKRERHSREYIRNRISNR